MPDTDALEISHQTFARQGPGNLFKLFDLVRLIIAGATPVPAAAPTQSADRPIKMLLSSPDLSTFARHLQYTQSIVTVGSPSQFVYQVNDCDFGIHAKTVSDDAIVTVMLLLMADGSATIVADGPAGL